MSLAELRRFEVQRVAETRAAVKRAESERIECLAHAEATARAEADARLRAAHDAVMAREHERTAAEREARRRVETAATAEQARAMLALETLRREREHELRIQLAARQRPGWMIALTATAVLAASVMGYVGIQHRDESVVAERGRLLAQRDRDAARASRDAAIQRLAATESDLTVLAAKVDAAVDRLAKAQTKAEQEAANRELAKQRQALLDRRNQAAHDQAAHDHTIRTGGVHLGDCAGQVLCR